MSLLAYLVEEGPTVTLRRSNNSAGTDETKPIGTLTESISYVAPKFIKKWQGFDRHTLWKMYGHILSNERERQRFHGNDPFNKNAWDESSLGNFLYKYNSEAIREALKESKGLLGRQELITMVRGDCALPIERDKKRPYRPDWACVIIKDGEGTEEQRKSIMPGDTKPSTCWRFFEELEAGNIQEGAARFTRKHRPRWFRPLVQIFTYCVWLETRYGYVISDKELLAVRISPGESADREEQNDKAEYSERQSARIPKGSNKEHGNDSQQKDTGKKESNTTRARKKKGKAAKNNRGTGAKEGNASVTMQDAEEEEENNQDGQTNGGTEEVHRTREAGILEFASIKWGEANQSYDHATDGEGNLSVNLALWWLHMLAANDNTIKSEYQALENEILGGANDRPDFSGQLNEMERSNEGTAQDGSDEATECDSQSVGGSTHRDDIYLTSFRDDSPTLGSSERLTVSGYMLGKRRLEGKDEDYSKKQKH